jgi:hypothetical protein
MAGTSPVMTLSLYTSPLIHLALASDGRFPQLSKSNQQQFEMFDNQPAQRTACVSRAVEAH